MKRALRKSLYSKLFLTVGVSATESGWPKGLARFFSHQPQAQKPAGVILHRRFVAFGEISAASKPP